MLSRILKAIGIPEARWRVVGYDTFAGEWYHLAGPFRSERAAQRAAAHARRRLGRSQPSRISGGPPPAGLQDQVYIVRPDGSRYAIDAL